jgi:hypothetical protein
MNVRLEVVSAIKEMIWLRVVPMSEGSVIWVKAVCLTLLQL